MKYLGGGGGGGLGFSFFLIGWAASFMWRFFFFLVLHCGGENFGAPMVALSPPSSECTSAVKDIEKVEGGLNDGVNAISKLWLQPSLFSIIVSKGYQGRLEQCDESSLKLRTLDPLH